MPEPSNSASHSQIQAKSSRGMVISHRHNIPSAFTPCAPQRQPYSRRPFPMSSLNKKFPRLLPEPIRKGMRVDTLIDTAFKAYNGARLAEACRLFTQKMIAGEGT